MNCMKKLVTICLCGCLLLGSSMTVFAQSDAYATTVSAMKANCPDQKLIVNAKGVVGFKTMADLGAINVAVQDLDNGSKICYIPDRTMINAFCSEINSQLQNNISDNSFYYLDQESGRFLVCPGTGYYQLNENGQDAIYHALLEVLAGKSASDKTIELGEECFALVPYEIPENVLVNKYYVKGSCTTSLKGSSSNRINNVQIAANNVNNMVLMPGQEVSVSEAFKPRTKENGYKDAGAYSGGKVIQATGGGICQVSSTIYNAAMNSGLTVIERHPHSMPVHYLPLGMDAAISSGLKDLRIRNDYTFPVLFEAFADSKNVTVRIYTNELLTKKVNYKLHAVNTSSLSAKTYLEISANGAVVEDRYIGSSKYNPMSTQED